MAALRWIAAVEKADTMPNRLAAPSQVLTLWNDRFRTPYGNISGASKGTPTMEIVSVLLIVIAGTVVASGFGRLALGWAYDIVAVATSVVIFGAGGLALIVLTKLGVSGIVLTLGAAILLTFLFVKFNSKGADVDDRYETVLGRTYWLASLIIFTISGLKSWEISVYITKMYSLDGNAKSFVFALCLFVLAGGLSILMFIREYKRA